MCTSTGIGRARTELAKPAPMLEQMTATHSHTQQQQSSIVSIGGLQMRKESFNPPPFPGSGWETRLGNELSGPLNQLNAILPLLQPFDRYRALSAIGSAIGRSHLALSRIQTACSLRAQPRDSGAIVSRTPSKQARNKNVTEALILNRVLDHDGNLNGRGPLRQ